jgi:NADPH2:quinone reductase
MKALLCREFASLDALRVDEVPDPVPGDGDVVIDVEAATVNYPDALIVQGKYQVRPELPFVPGFECAGVVRDAGPNAGIAPGTRVLGLVPAGAFAERVAIPANAVWAIGDKLAYSEAAALPMTYGTVWHALKDRAALAAGETLLVLGAGGGIGTAAIQLGKLAGAKVIAAASSEDKLDMARSLGADHALSYAADNWRDELKAITGSAGVDVVCDPVGGKLTEPAFRSTGWGGRYLMIGFATGEIPKLPLNLPLLKGSSLVGVFWGEFRKRDPQASREELDWLIAQAADGKIQPVITKRYPLDAAVDAMRDVYERRAVGKLIVEP